MGPTNKLSCNLKRKLRRRTLHTRLTDNAITNLSDYTLTATETELLTKGLSYIPSYNHDLTSFSHHIDTFIQRTYTDYYFRHKTNKPKPLYRKTDWTPPTPLNPHLISLTHDIKHITQNTLQKGHVLEQGSDHKYEQAIKHLSQNKHITIKKADKGGSVVILNTSDYIHTALTHLHQDSVYQVQDKDHTKELMDDINSFIIQTHGKGLLTDDIAHFIKPVTPPRTPLFYYLPKIHKPNNPPRPIISGCDSPTDRISRYLTTLFQPIAETQPSYLKDTKHFVQLIRDIPPLTDDVFLVTADVTSLYTNIPHDEGIHTILRALDNHRHILPKDTPNNTIIQQFLRFILQGNYFDFLDTHYKQLQGTAMGTKMAPPYANIFMADFEQKLTNNFLQHILLWKRFIDDIFFLWRGTKASLDAFIEYANTLHPTIKLTFDYSHYTANYLDTTTYKDKHHKLQTTIYRKPTDKNLLLHYSSHHPQHLKRNIVYTQALRYKRIISEPHLLNQELGTLKDIFLARGYPLRLINQQINKAKLIPRHTLLMDKPKLTPNQPTNRKLTIKVPFHPAHNHTKKEIVRSWRRTSTDSTLNKLWPTPPTFLEVTGKTLRDRLVHTRQRSPATSIP